MVTSLTGDPDIQLDVIYFLLQLSVSLPFNFLTKKCGNISSSFLLLREFVESLSIQTKKVRQNESNYSKFSDKNFSSSSHRVQRSKDRA